MKTAMREAFERAWLATTNKDAIRQAVRVLDRQEKRAHERKQSSKQRTVPQVRQQRRERPV